ncbi:hypothetical protein ACVDG3_19825 [Meridianimarinicoccus sp. RP-17]|uniref:hypothetical protein n=1 Tax=Meridianimarinicoccus zhengii TaxID=2056810 RepID=UPI000DAE309A|nr:hypothetical protein [Phycocomes zhengii]
MDTHRLGIGRLVTDCTVITAADQAAPLERRLNRALREDLPGRLSSLAGPLLDGREGVIRLRRLRLDLALEGPFEDAALARLFAAHIAAALRRALADPHAESRQWDTTAAYVAAYVAHRVGMVREPDWAFPDFTALRYLGAAEVAVELLGTRPQVLAELASLGRSQGGATVLAPLIPEPDAARLVQRWSGTQAPSTWDAADGQAVIAALDGEALAALRGSTPGRAVLALALAAQGTGAGPAARLGAALTVAGMVLALDAIQPDGQGAAVVADVLARLQAEAVPQAPGVPAALAGFLHRTARDTAGRTRLATLVTGLQTRLDRRDTATRGRAPTDRPARTGGGLGGVYRSELAGMALLLPQVARFGGTLSSGQARDLLLALVPDPEAATDPGLAAFLPVQDPPGTAPVLPPLPAAAVAALAEESRMHLDGQSGAEAWSGLILAGFATQLPGLKGSSRAYLQRQFLSAAGRVETGAEAIRVTLDGPPLAIVLRMAGLTGPQGRMPHLGDRRLILETGGQQ